MPQNENDKGTKSSIKSRSEHPLFDVTVKYL